MDTLPSCPSQDRDPPSKLRLPRVTRATTESPVLACHSSRGISSMWLTVLMPGSHQERTSSILIPRIRQRWIILPSISERIYQRCSRWMCILPRIPSLKSFFFFFKTLCAQYCWTSFTPYSLHLSLTVLIPKAPLIIVRAFYPTIHSYRLERPYYSKHQLHLVLKLIRSCLGNNFLDVLHVLSWSHFFLVLKIYALWWKH